MLTVLIVHISFVKAKEKRGGEEERDKTKENAMISFILDWRFQVYSVSSSAGAKERACISRAFETHLFIRK